MNTDDVAEIQSQIKTNTYGYPKRFKTILPQIIAVFIKNLVLLGFGSTLGFATILIPAVQVGGYDSLKLTAQQISWISSVNLICVPLGCLFSGYYTSTIGRKRAMQLVNLPFIIASIIFYTASSPAALYVALSLSGIAGGLLEAPVLVYVAEITQPHIRGTLASTSTLSIIFGIFLQFLFGIFLKWRIVALVNCMFPILAIFFLFFVPESPHWLLLKDRNEEAKRSFQWLRGWTTEEAVEAEIKDLQSSLKLTATRCQANPKTKMEIMKEKIKLYKNRSFYYPFAIVNLGFFLCHFSGMTTLQTYAVLIFDTLEAPIDKYYATVILGVVQALGTCMCMGLIHFTGKRPLTFFSTMGCAICFFTVGCYAFYIQQKSGIKIDNLLPKNLSTGGSFPNTLTNCSLSVTETIENCAEDNTLVWIPLTFLIGSALISHTGIRLLPWILIGEVFSPELRSTSSGLASGAGYIMGFVSNKVFLTMVKDLTLPGTFWFYSCVSLLGTIILYFILPETEGYPLIDIEKHFFGIKKLPNKVHRSQSSRKMKNINMITFSARIDSADLERFQKIGISNDSFISEPDDMKCEITNS